MTAAKTSLVAIGAVLVLIVAAMSAANWAGCAWYGYQTDRTTRYAFGVGCMVKMPAGWTPRRELRTEQ
ncbi:hypothetical protein D3C77_133770 [compost metagenome]